MARKSFFLPWTRIPIGWDLTKTAKSKPIMITTETIRKMIQDLPGAYEESSYGTPGFKAKGGKLFARIHQEEDAVVILLGDIAMRDQLMASDPDTYYITEHYRKYGTVLVATTIAPDEFFALLVVAWKRVALKRDLKAYEDSGDKGTSESG
tara:strand:+ start:1784 stop:2236 length:453 start_codon:yes stop_codon:yes gene_type:complete